MNIYLSDKEIKYLTAKDIKLITKSLEIISSGSDDTRYITNVKRELRNFILRLRRDKLGFMINMFNQVEYELNQLLRLKQRALNKK